MSWNGYIDTLLASQVVSEAAIFGKDGSQWAASPGLNITPQEMQVINACFKNGKADPLQAGGVKLAGKKYMFLTMTPDNIIFKKSSNGGGSIGASAQAVVVALYKEGMQPGACNTKVMGMIDYLKGAGY